MTWFSAGILTNPATDTILADTGALAGAGSGRVSLIIGATVAAVATIEHRNAANNGNISSQVVAVLANSPYGTEIPGIAWADSERFRIRLNAVIVGSVQASLFMF